MRVKVVYLGLLRGKVGKKDEEYTLEDGSSLSDLLNTLVDTYGGSLRSVFKADEDSWLDPTFIATVNGVLRDPIRGNGVLLNDGDTIALMTLISGG
ncbi:MAG: MoaD/ThiS family protein [Candidatus Bathyarchaeota archaeon]|nr:MoaD/ThiS family protein [Candidatus Bathyarchaeota archaeon]